MADINMYKYKYRVLVQWWGVELKTCHPLVTCFFTQLLCCRTVAAYFHIACRRYKRNGGGHFRSAFMLASEVVAKPTWCLFKRGKPACQAKDVAF